MDQKPGIVRDDALLQAVVESSADAIFTKDLQGIIRSWNPGAAAMYGYAADEVIGRHVSILAPPERVGEVDDILAQLRRGEQVRHFLTERIAKDGRRLVVSVSISPVRDPSTGAIVAASTIARDMTESVRSQRELAIARQRLEVITRSGADGLTIQDREGKLVYANDAAARMCGMDGAEALLRAPLSEVMARFEMLDEDGRAFPATDLPGRRVLEGGAEAEAIVQVLDKVTGTRTWSLVRATPVPGESGVIEGAVNVFHDITNRMQIEKRLEVSEARERFLSEASAELSRSLDWRTTLQRIADLAVPRLADWCGVDVVRPDGSIEMIALAHVDPEKVKWALALRGRFPVHSGAMEGISQVVRTGEPQLIPEVTDEMIASAGGGGSAGARILRKLELSSAIIVPLVARGRILGALELVWAESGGRYSGADLALAQDLASRAAFAIDNARAYEERDAIAGNLQRSLLPPSVPDIPGFEVAARYRAPGEGIEIGGDFYDVFPTEDGAWTLVVGDVCGRGIGAASLMAAARHTTRTASLSEQRPSEVLRIVDRRIRQEVEDGRFCTICYVRMRANDSGARLTICAAGHPLPVLVRADGTASFVAKPGHLLGVISGELQLFDEVVELGKADMLFVYSDGVTDERRGTEQFGDERLLEMLRGCAGMPASETADIVEKTLAEFREGEGSDDLTFLVLTKPAY